MRSVLVLMVLAAVVHAEPRILVLADEERAGALELPLVTHHATVSVGPAPSGDLPLDRAAAAERACVEDGCWAAVYADGTQVTVVGADGTLRHAPLPIDASARVFAAIAISLLDELAETPEAPRAIAPALAIHEAPAVPPTHSAPEERAMLEAGVAATPSSVGAQVELTFVLRPHVRIGAFAGIDQLFDGIRDLASDTTAYHFGGEARYSIGDGPRHWEVGAIGGAMRGVIRSSLDFMGQTINYDDHDTGGYLGARLGYTRDVSSTSVTFAIAPILMFDFRGQGNDKTPGVMTSLTFGLPI